MMHIRAAHWAAALACSAALHLTIVHLVYAPDWQGAGGDGISVRLGAPAAVAGAVDVSGDIESAKFDHSLTKDRRAMSAVTPPAVTPLVPADAAGILDAPPEMRGSQADSVDRVEEPGLLSADGESIDSAKTLRVPTSSEAVRLREPEVIEAVRSSATEVFSSPPRNVSAPSIDEEHAGGANRPVSQSNSQARPSTGAANDAGSRLAREYYARLALWLSSHRRYPRRARRSGQEGTVEVEFAIDRRGRLLSHRVVSSSGFALLDDEARALVERAAPMPPIPDDLGKDSLIVTAPISFTLR